MSYFIQSKKMKKNLTVIVGLIVLLVGLWMNLKNITDADVYVNVGLILIAIYIARICIVYLYKFYKQKK